MGMRQFSPRRMAEARLQKLALRSVLDDIASGHVQLLDVTRAWLWRDDDVIGLLETVIRGLPCDVVTMVATGGEASLGFRPVTGTGTEARDNRAPARLVVDGQQRLTALFQALRSPRPVRTLGTAGRRSHHLHYIDMPRMNDGNVPVTEAILSVAVDADGRALDSTAPDLRQPDVQFARMTVPANRILDFPEWEEAFTAFWDAPGRDPAQAAEARRTVRTFEHGFVGAVSRYTVAVLTMPDTVTGEDVWDTYVNLNTASARPRTADRRAA